MAHDGGRDPPLEEEYLLPYRTEGAKGDAKPLPVARQKKRWMTIAPTRYYVEDSPYDVEELPRIKKV
jgi:hypothetical protein